MWSDSNLFLQQEVPITAAEPQPIHQQPSDQTRFNKADLRFLQWCHLSGLPLCFARHFPLWSINVTQLCSSCRITLSLFQLWGWPDWQSIWCLIARICSMLCWIYRVWSFIFALVSHLPGIIASGIYDWDKSLSRYVMCSQHRKFQLVVNCWDRTSTNNSFVSCKALPQLCYSDQIAGSWGKWSSVGVERDLPWLVLIHAGKVPVASQDHHHA